MLRASSSRGDVVIAYGDIVFDDFILRNLLRHERRYHHRR